TVTPCSRGSLRSRKKRSLTINRICSAVRCCRILLMRLLKLCWLFQPGLPILGKPGFCELVLKLLNFYFSGDKEFDNIAGSVILPVIQADAKFKAGAHIAHVFL